MCKIFICMYYSCQLTETIIDTRRCGVGVAVLNDLLYAVGGHDGQSYLNSVERSVKRGQLEKVVCADTIRRQTNGRSMCLPLEQVALQWALPCSTEHCMLSVDRTASAASMLSRGTVFQFVITLEME